MKFLPTAAPTAVLTAALLLTGCASPPGPPSTPRPPSAATVAPTAQTGELSPLATNRIDSDARAVVTLLPPSDLWDRIRRGFKMPNLDTDLVREREQWYATRPDYIDRMTSRSNKYIFHIVEELERRDMPTELALLPYIESAFNPQAVSSARAAGMWQFMPATGNDYDLKQNIFRDDRRDVIASTRAALDYLQRLYGMFGDWHLALAAYNWGEGSVGRAIARNQKNGLPTSYIDLNMPAETRLYVPKLQAVKNIVAQPAQFNLDLPLIANHPYFQTVALPRDIDVALASKLADVRIEDFRALNPAAHKPILLAANHAQILLPWDNAAVFQRNFEAYNQGQYASWTAWVVPKTMTVAEAANQSGMSESDLRSINNIPPRMLVKARSTLIVPRGARMQTDVTAAVAENGQLSFEPEVVTRRTTVRAGRNDSVTSIARRYKLNPKQVANWNDVDVQQRFKRGVSVVVYLPVRAAKSTRVGSGARTTRASRNAKAAGRDATRSKVVSKNARPSATSNKAKTKSANTSAAVSKRRQ